MFYFILAFGLSLLYSIFVCKQVVYITFNTRTLSHNASQFLLVLAFVPLFLISALRYDIGIDYTNVYVKGFENILRGDPKPWEMGGRWELGFVVLIKLIQLFTSSPGWLFFISSFLFLFFIYKGIQKYSSNYFLSISIFISTSLFFGSLNSFRQYICIAIFLYAFDFIIYRKPIKYFFWILIACSIHLSSLAYIPLYFFAYIRISRRRIVFLLLFSIMMLPFVDVLFKSFVSFTKYAIYLDTKFSLVDFSVSDFIIDLILLLMCLYSYQKKNRIFGLYAMFTLITFVISLYSGKIFLIYRLRPLFLIISLISFPKYIQGVRNKCVRLVVIVVFLSICALLKILNGVVLKGEYVILPYRSILSIMDFM